MSVVKAVGNARAPIALLEDFLRCPGIATSQKKLRETGWCKKKAIISFLIISFVFRSQGIPLTRNSVGAGNVGGYSYQRTSLVT